MLESKSNLDTVPTFRGFLGLKKACGDQLDHFFSNLGAHQNLLGCFKKYRCFTFHLENPTLKSWPQEPIFLAHSPGVSQSPTVLAWLLGVIVAGYAPLQAPRQDSNQSHPRKLQDLTAAHRDNTFGTYRLLPLSSSSHLVVVVVGQIYRPPLSWECGDSDATCHCLSYYRHALEMLWFSSR